MKKVVVVGAGYAGIAAVKRLQKDKTVDITLIDKFDFHEMKTEIHLIASGKTSKDHARIDFKDVIDMERINFIQSEVSDIDYNQKNVVLNDSSVVSYDYLIIATGSKTNYFGNESNLVENTLTFWNSEEAVNTWNAIKNTVDLNPKATITVIGAGATGIEFITDLSESLNKKYPNNDIKLNLVAADDRPLVTMDMSASNKAIKYLTKMNINSYFSCFVKSVKKDCIILNDDSEIRSDVTVWLAGVSGNCGFTNSVECVNQRIVIDKFMQVEKLSNVFVAGDVGFYIDPKVNKPLVQMVEIAELTGKFAAMNVLNLICGRELSPIKGDIHGTNVSFGSHRAIAKVMGIKMSGIVARISKFMINVYYYMIVGGIKLVLKKVL